MTLFGRLYFTCKSKNLEVYRFLVPPEKKSWNLPFSDYNPTEFTLKYVNKPWSDPDNLKKFSPQWNTIDGNVNRKSHIGAYQIEDNLPINPLGRTGIKGKGM